MSKHWTATIESVVIGYVTVITEGDEPPTEDEVLEAARYVENHQDTVVSAENVINVEEY